MINQLGYEAHLVEMPNENITCRANLIILPGVEILVGWSQLWLTVGGLNSLKN